MRNRFVAIAAAAVVLLTTAATAVPGLAQGELTQGDVDAALERRRAATASLEEATARFEKAMYDEQIVREQIADLAREVSRLEQEIGARRVAVKDLVLERYMAGGSTGTERVFTARTFTDIPIQNEYYALMNARDIAMLRGLETAEALHVEQQALLDTRVTEQAALVEELTVLAADLGAALERADADYTAVAAAYTAQEEERRRREEAERQRRLEEERRAREAAEQAARDATTTTTPSATTTTSGSGSDSGGDTTTTAPQESTTTAPPTTTTTTVPSAPPPVVTDGRTCPVNAASSFSDTWGAPRSGGRTHKGVDMVAARNAPLVAIESGTVTRTSNSSLGGLSVYLTGVSGSRYYYAHLEYIASGIRGGTSVSVGDLLGGNGSTGNAPDWLPHLHFQYAPPGSDWINPYPLVRALC
jgi:murein DD-endopeptidase MepM/ murein hydrolase activator NlpD